MVCVESPEVWFEDVITVPVTTRRQYITIDPIFCETVVQDTIRVISAVFDQPTLFGAAVLPREPETHLSQIRLDVLTPEALGCKPSRVTLTIRGIRSGYEGHRFKEFTSAQMERNAAFWRSAYE